MVMLYPISHHYSIEEMTSTEFNHFYAKHSSFNDDLYDNLKYLSLRLEEKYLVLLHNKKILGVLSYQPDPKKANLLWGKTIAVHQEYKNKGLSKYLLEALFIITQTLNCKIRSTSYSQQGFTRLRNTLHELKNYYAIELIEPEKNHWLPLNKANPTHTKKNLSKF